jgi:hypothetical protein
MPAFDVAVFRSHPRTGFERLDVSADALATAFEQSDRPAATDHVLPMRAATRKTCAPAGHESDSIGAPTNRYS